MAIFKPLMNVEYVIALNDLTGTPTSSKIDDKEQVLLRGQSFRPTKESITWYAAPWQLEKIVRTGVQAGEAFKVCRIQQGKSSEFTITRLSDAGEPAAQPHQPAQPIGWNELPPSPLERQLAASIVKAHERNAQQPVPFVAQPVTAPQPQNVTRMPTPANYAPPPPVQTLAEQILTSALIAAIDASLLAEQYAKKRGFESFAFSPEDVRAMALTLVINMTKGVTLTAQAVSAKTDGAAQWQH